MAAYERALQSTTVPTIGSFSRTPDERLLDTLCAQVRSGAMSTKSPSERWVFLVILFVVILAFSRAFGFTLFEICI